MEGTDTARAKRVQRLDKDRTTRLLHVAKAVILVALIAGLAWVGVANRALLTDGTLTERIGSLGVLGIVLVVALYTVGVAALVPGTFLVLAVSVLYPYWQAVGLVTLGSLLGALLCFVLARGLGRGFVTHLLHHQVATADERLQRHGFVTMLLLRLVMVPYAVVSYAAGLTGMRMAPFAAGSILGVLPTILLTVRLFGELGRAATVREVVVQAELWAILATLGLIVAGGMWVRRRLSAAGDLAIVELDENDV